MYTMEEIFVKKEPEEPFDDSEDGISINYSTPSTSAGPLTSGIAIKQEIKEELNDSHNFMIYDESGVKKESEVSTDKENDLHGSKQVQPKFKGKDKMFLDSGSKINDSDEESDNSGNGDESEDFSCNIKEEGWDSDFTEDDTNLLHNEENNEDKAMFGTKIKVEYHGIQYDESGIDSEDVNKEIPEKIVLPKAGKESHKEGCLKPIVGQEKWFKCDLCPKKFPRKHGLYTHKKYIHKKDELEKFKCIECDYATVRKGYFNQHLKMHDKNKYLKCHFCPYIAAELKTLNAHIISKHKLENKGQNKIIITSKIHTCAKCSYSTVRKSDFDNHIKVCLKLENAIWYDCHICQYRTIQKRNLVSHIKTHNKIKELKCSFCQHQCNKKSSLDNHILIKHSDILNESNKNIITSKVHACKHCNYKTTLASTLKRHLKNTH
ncbi:unnamed protein product [Brassicogethes aeneus]|uniref:C2H2-type domain-containing protein n=1 Tax=Brassicogethes aeneus TaxID=1431903 RepID=A0A9P0AR56_BRAAE|nr:unnamed protein product [Brassicogethes aeneus]